jgi:hypothetical protein
MSEEDYVLAGIGVFWLLFFLAMVVFNFIPTIVAFKRRHRNSLAILIVDLLLGWTVLGWIACLIWAFSDNTEDRVPQPHYPFVNQPQHPGYYLPPGQYQPGQGQQPGVWQPQGQYYPQPGVNPSQYPPQPGQAAPLPGQSGAWPPQGQFPPQPGQLPPQQGQPGAYPPQGQPGQTPSQATPPGQFPPKSDQPKRF